MFYAEISLLALAVMFLKSLPDLVLSRPSHPLYLQLFGTGTLLIDFPHVPHFLFMYTHNGIVLYVHEIINYNKISNTLALSDVK